MEFLKFKEALFEKAKNQGFQECEVYFTNRKRISISVYEQEVENYSLTKDLGLSFREKLMVK